MKNNKIKITILGSGSFPSDLEHYGPSYLLEINDKRVLVDCGMGTNFRLIELGIDPDDIDYIFLTHFHSDHTTELVPLLMRLYLKIAIYNIKISPKEIYGPKGTPAFIETLKGAYYHKKHIDSMGEQIRYRELEDKKSFEGFSVTPFSVQHLDVPSYAYRFEIDGKTVVFSGDTSDCEGIKKAAKDADVFIADCSFHKGIDVPVHLNTKQIGTMAKEAKVKKVILSHLLPSGYDKDLVSEVKETFDGEVVLARDKMEIEV